MIKRFLSFIIWCFVTQAVSADNILTGEQNAEMLTMVKAINHGSIAYHATVMQKMLVEANFAADRLKLPTHYPIRMTDIEDNFVGLPWFRVLLGTNRFPDTVYGSHIFDPSISREIRLRAIKLGIGGYIDNTNFEFGFEGGRLRHIMRLSEPNVEYYAHDLDKLIGKPSLINTNSCVSTCKKMAGINGALT